MAGNADQNPDDGRLPLDPLRATNLSESMVGTHFARFDILSVAGRGGMGLVFKARHPESGILLALKVLPVLTRRDREPIRRFLAEAEVLARLDHPNIPKIHTMGREGHLYYIGTEYIKGRTVARIIDGSDAFTTQQALLVVRGVAQGLSAAHRHGILHRDIKSDNLMIDREGLVKVLDFGIAQDLRAKRRITLGDQCLGNPEYCSPEQLSTGEMDLVLVFTRTKHGADRVVKKLGQQGIEAVAIHGNKSQPQRERALALYRKGQVRVLVATDIAARGIDIPGVSHVFNFELPNVAEQYVHRIGRTARAGRAGVALAFCAPDERDYLRDIERLTKVRLGEVPLPPSFNEEVKRIGSTSPGHSGDEAMSRNQPRRKPKRVVSAKPRGEGRGEGARGEGRGERRGHGHGGGQGHGQGHGQGQAKGQGGGQRRRHRGGNGAGNGGGGNRRRAGVRAS